MQKILSIIILITTLNVWALEVPPLTAPVEDLAGVITPSQEAELNHKIRTINESGLAQISVLIINSLEGEVLEQYSIKVVENWKLGTKDKDNGLLILMAMQERKIRIEVGQGLEGDITDLKSKRLIDQMGPYMREGNFAQALDVTISEINEVLQYNTPEAKTLREEALVQEQIKRTQMMKSLADALVVLLNVVLVLAGIGMLYYSFVVFKQSKQQLHNEKSELVSKNQKHSEDIKQLQIKKSQMKLDPTKLDYIKRVEHLSSLQSEKSRLSSAISNMKKFLGE